MHRTPASGIVKPVRADKRRRSRCREIAAIPELDHGRTPPSPADVLTHPERVLERPPSSISKGLFRPPVWSGTPVEIDEERIPGELDARDGRRNTPARERLRRT